jgi:uncharacterized protein involved in outer membrane biogenesis
MDRMRQLLMILLVILLTMIGTSALFLAVVVGVKETVRARRRIKQRRDDSRPGQHTKARMSLHVLKPLR